ncbi:MAG: arsenate reductase ArsC [Spirochaetales bacterium]|nr:arsenate reductase ArsC [Spirochaetales bacterium]
MKKPKILFLCTGNSCRSQMAEGFARFYKGEDFDVYSAGVEKHGMNPYAVAVMKEVGIDLAAHKSKTVDELPEEPFDFVVTVCDNAKERCPWFPARTKLVHRSFPDPPALTAQMNDGPEKMEVYRRVRDQIEAFIKTIPEVFQEQ